MSPTVATRMTANKAIARGATATARPIASPSPTAVPRHSPSAATIVASVVIAVRTATTDWSAIDAIWPSVVEPPLRSVVSTDGDSTPVRKPPIPAGSARARNSDHSRPKVSNVRPTTRPRSSRGPAATTGSGRIQPGAAGGWSGEPSGADGGPAGACASGGWAVSAGSGASPPSAFVSSRSTAEQYARRRSVARRLRGIPQRTVVRSPMGCRVRDPRRGVGCAPW